MQNFTLDEALKKSICSFPAPHQQDSIGLYMEETSLTVVWLFIL